MNMSNNALAISNWSPTVDVDETNKEFRIKADMSGVKKEDIYVEYYNGILAIKGEKHRGGSFTRNFTLPDNVRLQDIDASYKKGVLLLTLSKSAATPQRTALC